MQSSDYINLLNCTSRFISYGKHNVLSIFEWEQNHLSKQTGKPAVLLKSYKQWNEVENKIISGKGVDLDIEGCDEKILFFDISQTVAPKFGRKAKEDTISILTEELIEMPSTQPTEIGFSHKHRGLLLTALWTELSIFQNEYEKCCNNNGENLLKHISVIYIIHSHFKSNWQSDDEIKMVFKTFSKTFTENTDISTNTVKLHLIGAYFSQLFQSAINLIVKIEKRFETLVSNSDSEASENYYQKVRFYDICDKEKVAICRLKPTEKINANLSIESYEIIETLPYKPNMEREAFLEYLQSIFNNGLTEEHLVLVRRKNISGVTVVTTYRVDVRNWGVKQNYVNFNIVTSNYPISFYLRQISSEYLDKEEDNSNGVAVQSEQKPKSEVKLKPEKQNALQTEAPRNIEHIKENKADKIDHTTKISQNKPLKKKPMKKKLTDVLDRVSKLKDEMQNKTC